MIGIIVLESPACAQRMRADDTLAVPTTVDTVDNQQFTIDGGTRLGDSLFHSFEAFSIPTNGSAIFNNPTDVVNIINRVTGGQVSDIDGLIKAQGNNTNLFLLNRSGIVFGPNAQLEIGGSFIGSTAESLQFTNGTEFLTDRSRLNPLLSMSTPVGLQFGSASQGIEVNDVGYGLLADIPLTVDSSASLRTNAGRTLALVGGGIDFNGGVVAAPGGNVEIGSVREGVVAFDSSFGRFDYEGATQFGSVDFGARSLVDASSLLFDAFGAPYSFGAQGGSIQLQGDRILFEGDSRAIIQNYGAAASGDIKVAASDMLELTTETVSEGRDPGISTASFAAGAGGDVVVVVPNVVLAGDVTIGSDTYGAATGGDVTIAAKDSIIFNPSQFPSPEQAEIDTVSYGSGAAGTLTITTKDLVMFGSGVVSLSLGAGSGGLVAVDAERIAIAGGGNISSSTLFEGKGGNVEITADVIDIAGINPFSFLPSSMSSPTTGMGDAGNITVNTRQLYLRDGGRMGSSTLAGGDAGTVTVTASELVSVDGTVPGSVNPSLIISSANTVDLTLRLFFERAGILLPVVPTGDSGNVTINAPNLVVSDGAQVTVRNDGTGNAGTLTANVEMAYLSDRAGITASTQQGSGGNVVLNVKDALLLRQESRLSAAAGGEGNGGNITLTAPVIVALENSDITASAIQGSGGNIQINASAILGTAFREVLTPASDITASSEFGVSGEVQINTIEGDPSSGIVSLPEEVADSSDRVVAGCANDANNQFVASGRGGLPPSPLDHLHNPSIWSDMREIASLDASSSESLESAAIPGSALEPFITEASDWLVNEQGDVLLVDSSSRNLARNHSDTACLKTAI